MAKIYQVFHDYGTDGGFGDYIPESELVMTFARYEDAKAFVDRFAKPHIYERPYASLDCGDLNIVESDIIGPGELNLDEVSTEDFWWLHNEVLDDPKGS